MKSENCEGKQRQKFVEKKAVVCLLFFCLFVCFVVFGVFFSRKTLRLPCKRQKQAGMVRFSLFILTVCPAPLKQPCRSGHLAASVPGWKWQILLYLQKSSNGQEQFESVLTWAYLNKQIF